MNRHQARRTVLVPEARNAKAGQFLRLEDETVKHLKKVLRLEWGTDLRVVDGMGGVFQGALEQVSDSGGIQFGELERRDTAPIPVELGVCLPKSTAMEWIVEKAMECGATRLVPIVSARSVVRPDPKERAKYAVKWQRIADEALEQCERSWRMNVSEPVFWNEIASKWPSADAASFVFVSETRADGLALAKETWSKLSAAAARPLRLVIGPEGGLASSEREDLSRMGFAEASLGPHVLRVETAAVMALSWTSLARLTQ